MSYFKPLFLAKLFAASLLLSACSGEGTPALPEPKLKGPAPAPAPVEPAPVDFTGKKVFFTAPKDGDVVTSPFKIQFGVEGMTVDPAGQVKENMGHHHLIVNGTSIEQGKMVPKDETHFHYGKGETEAELTLVPGDYTLTMQFADGNHMSFGDKMSTQIKVKVEAPK